MALRIGALAIAAAAAVDPSFTNVRPVRPEVAVVSSPRLPDPALVDRVVSALEDRFQVVRGPSFGASATVTTGDSLPPLALRNAPVGFAVEPVAHTPFVSITKVRSPARATAHGRVDVTVTLRTQAARGKDVAISLMANGLEIERKTIAIASDDSTDVVTLGLVSAAPGPLPYTVTASVDSSSHVVDGTVDVGDRTLRVLSFDKRPSWSSGFVRRALEADGRFEVVSRVFTSRGTSSTIGEVPPAMTSQTLASFDAVIVGGLEVLSPAEIAALDTYMRERGGSVVLLPDEPDAPAALRQLSGITAWKATAGDEAAGTPPASEFIEPAAESPWVRITDGALKVAVGAGELTIPHGIDMWRYRQRDDAAFDRWWRLLIASAADRARSDDDSRSAVDQPVPDGRRAVPDERTLVAAWAGAHRGRAMSEDALDRLPDELAGALAPPVEARAVFPMRSGWWVLPFGLLLSIEWWTRRRAGLR